MPSIRKNVREVIRGISGSVGMPEFSVSKIDYDQYWKARGDSAGLQPRFPIMADLISGGDRVLDVGCGDGTFLAYPKDRKSVDEKGVDISEVAVERAQEKGISAQVETLSYVAEVRSKEAFDHVVMSEVIEHVPSPEEFVLNAWRLTSEFLIITCPNIGYWPHQLRLLLGRFPVQWAHHPGDHLRFWIIPDF